MTRLHPGDLQLLANRDEFKGYSFNAGERNCLFVNGGGGRFLEAGYPLGVDIDFEGRGVAVADLDQDGAQDLVVRSVARRKVAYLHNEAATGARFARVDLVGTASNRDAVGAVVRIAAGGARQMRLRMAGNGFQAQSEGTLHFGLGKAERIDELTVHWPSGKKETFTDLPVDQRLRIVEGEGRVTVASLLGKAVKPKRTGIPEPVRAWKLDGSEWSPRPGKPLLVSFWASWCLPCQAEVPVIGRLHEALPELDLIAVSFEPDTAAARAFLDRNKPSYPVALSNPGAVAPLLEKAFGDGAMPMPAAVLLDGRGAIAKVFTGPLSARAVEEAFRELAP